jgi:hypothetical protein
VTTGEEGTFSPTHAHTGTDGALARDLMELPSRSPRPVAAKIAMKRRSKRTQKRVNESSLLPPITQSSTTPSNPGPHRRSKEVITPYVNHVGGHVSGVTGGHHRGEIMTPYVTHLGYNRYTDVTTPYILHTQYSQIQGFSPLPPGKETSKLSQSNVVEIRHELSFNNDDVAKLQGQNGQGSPLLERRSKLEKRHSPTWKLNPQQPDADGGRMQLRGSGNQVYDRTAGERVRFRERPRLRPDEPFSIRKKIEQFRRWHEEQYKEKIKKLKQEVDIQYEAEKKLGKSVVGQESDLEQTTNHRDDRDDASSADDKDNENHNEASEDGGGDKPRPLSSRTWNTWRDVNDSYAYTDVKKYIKENELMTSEKETWIRNWIIEVNKALEAEISGESL